MRSQNIERYKFQYKNGKALFDILFFIDESPFILLFGVKSENFSFELEVKNGFIISTKLDNLTYKELCRVLGLTYNPNSVFKPEDFFVDFNRKIPATANTNNQPAPHDIAPYRSVAEDSDKIYFTRWLDNNTTNNHVTEKNLEKTKTLLGQKAYETCKRKNISSCWTDDPTKRRQITNP
jgi:hypothetical protein